MIDFFNQSIMELCFWLLDLRVLLLELPSLGVERLSLDNECGFKTDERIGTTVVHGTCTLISTLMLSAVVWTTVRHVVDCSGAAD